jgi:hypothetical protein
MLTLTCLRRCQVCDGQDEPVMVLVHKIVTGMNEYLGCAEK